MNVGKIVGEFLFLSLPCFPRPTILLFFLLLLVGTGERRQVYIEGE